MLKLRVVEVTNNLETCPECANDTKEFPNLVSYVEDETGVFVIEPISGDFWPARDFFYMVIVKEFIVDSEDLK